MTFTMAKAVFHEMLAVAQEAAPLEACGLLAGTGDRAIKLYALTNADVSPEHFSMKPQEQFAAAKDMRALGLRMVGIWHSHPASPARMSAEDMRLAYTPDVVYVILSLAKPGRPQMKAFMVKDSVAHEVPVIIEEQKAEPL